MSPRALASVFAAWLGLLPGVDAIASVSLSGTRLIFDGSLPEASLQVINRSAHEVLIQAWLSAPENIEGEPETAGVGLPFVLTPHLARLDAGSRQTLRVLYQGAGMAKHVESLLHLYVLEVPRRSELNNPLSIAIRQRINLFYRPPGLSGDPAGTALRLRWTVTQTDSGVFSLQIRNPTAFHAALQDVRLGDFKALDYLLLAPGALHQVSVPATAFDKALTYSALNDYGGAQSYCAEPGMDARKHTEYRSKDC